MPSFHVPKLTEAKSFFFPEAHSGTHERNLIRMGLGDSSYHLGQDFLKIANEKMVHLKMYYSKWRISIAMVVTTSHEVCLQNFPWFSQEYLLQVMGGYTTIYFHPLVDCFCWGFKRGSGLDIFARGVLDRAGKDTWRWAFCLGALVTTKQPTSPTYIKYH